MRTERARSVREPAVPTGLAPVTSPLDARPIVVAVAGPNGAGKTTFYAAHLERVGLRFVNADDLARELEVDAYEAAEVAKQLREVLVAQGESFVFETVFSDPVGDKLEFLRRASTRGYTVALLHRARLAGAVRRARRDARAPGRARRAHGEARRALPLNARESRPRHPRAAARARVRQQRSPRAVSEGRRV